MVYNTPALLNNYKVQGEVSVPPLEMVYYIIKSQVELKAFESLINKKESRHSEHAKGKLLKYSKLEMQAYLSASDVNISIEEKKWLFLCRIKDIDPGTNHRWKQTIKMSQKTFN